MGGTTTSNSLSCGVRKVSTASPTQTPTRTPTRSPTLNPTRHPTRVPTVPPTPNPTRTPTEHPTTRPPSPSPSHTPTEIPTPSPTRPPTMHPTRTPTPSPTQHPTRVPTPTPTLTPTTHTKANCLCDGCHDRSSEGHYYGRNEHIFMDADECFRRCQEGGTANLPVTSGITHANYMQQNSNGPQANTCKFALFDSVAVKCHWYGHTPTRWVSLNQVSLARFTCYQRQ